MLLFHCFSGLFFRGVLSIFDTKVCPVTGLKIEVKSTWQVNYLEYKCKLGIIAESIIIAEPSGNSVIETFYKFRDALENIINDYPYTKNFVFIDNYTDFGRASHKARKEYVEYLNKNKKISKVIYIGLPKTLQVLVNFGAAINYTKYPVKVAQNYVEAISDAIIHLKETKSSNSILELYEVDKKKNIKKKNIKNYVNLKQIAENPIILKYIKKLTEYIKTINWYEYDEDLHLIKELDDNHPLNVLIETFFMIKFDISQVIREYEKQERELIKAHDSLKELNKNLENLVEQRTEELSRANKELKRLNKELQKAKERAEKANKNKTIFIASISHDLKTPLNSIIGYSSLGITKIEKLNKERIKNYLQQINSSGKRLLKLITDLIDINKFEAGAMEFEFKENNIILLVNNAVSELTPLYKEKNINMFIDNRLKNGIFKFDSLRISQVVINLISNAVKFTPENKTITITLSENDKEFMCSIEDEGPGIAGEDTDIIFEIFKMGKKSKNHSGSGLGLAISKNIIMAHNGRIWVENTNKGACFTFTFSKNL